MSTPVRRLPDGPLSAPRPATPPRTRRLKKRHHTGLIVLALIIGFGIYASNRRTYHSPSVTHDHSDLGLIPATVSIPAGGTGSVSLRLANSGPDDLDHNVTFTITTSDRLALTGPGDVVDNGVDDRFFPDSDCKISSPRLMRCESFVTVSVGRQAVWNVPVRVAAGTPDGTSETLTVTAVGYSTYTDPSTRNNSGIAYLVVIGRPGTQGPVTSTAPSSPDAPPTSAVPSSTVTTPTSTKPHTPASKRIGDAARDAVGPVSVVVGIVLGLALLIVIALALVARRQRKQPVSYSPPRRE